MNAGITLDAGALIAFDRNDRRAIAVLSRARETSATVTVPAPALAQAIRNPARQARLAGLLRATTTNVVALGRADATRVGRLLATSGTSDITDAHVVLCARRAGQAAVTSDPDDIRHLDPTLEIVVI